jgi:hypothetical protein
MMPIGSIAGGLVVAVADSFVSRNVALRVPYLIVLVGNLVLLAFALRHLTTARIEAVRAAGKVEVPGAVLGAEA